MTPKTSAPPDYGQLPETLPTSEGELLFVDSRCVTCHGYQGTGDGFLAEGMNPAPKDWTRPGSLASLSDSDLKHTILNGKGTMPGYPRLTDSQSMALVRHIRKLSRPAS